MGKHSVRIVKAQKGERGAFTVRELANDPIATQATLKSPKTNEKIPAPEGSLKNYLLNHAAELGGEDAYVAVDIHYKPDPGEQPRIAPGWTQRPVP